MSNANSRSILSFPDEYILIDLETTGLSPQYDAIIEICALHIKNAKISDKYYSLINPGYEIPQFITDLTGITQDMLADAPPIEDEINNLLSFIGNHIIVGHHVCFDIAFIDNAAGSEICNSYVDTLRLCRLLHRDRSHNRLIDLCKIYNIPNEHMHRAEQDCLITMHVFDICRKEFFDIYHDTDNVQKRLLPNHWGAGLKASEIVSSNDNFDVSHPVYGKTFVFTGVLEKMVRREAMQHVVDLGGEVADGVSKKINYLVLGNNDYCKSIKGGKSSKQKKAEALKLSGFDIDIIPEDVFYTMVDLEV